jgi:hypothetical protein
MMILVLGGARNDVWFACGILVKRSAILSRFHLL